MSEQYQEQSQQFPEELISTRHVANIPAEALPWSDEEPTKQIAVTELTFPEGIVYIASHGTRKLNKITEEVANQDKAVDEFGYTRLNSFFLRAARLEAMGDTTGTEKIQLARGQSNEFNGFKIKDFRESPRPNTRRIYYAMTHLDKVPTMPVNGAFTDGSAPLLIKLAITDKQHQIATLKQLTASSHTQLKKFGAGR